MSNTKPQPPNMCGIHRPSQDLQHLQPGITHRHTGKIWRTPKTILSHKTHVEQNSSQARHLKILRHSLTLNWVSNKET